MKMAPLPWPCPGYRRDIQDVGGHKVLPDLSPEFEQLWNTILFLQTDITGNTLGVVNGGQWRIHSLN